MISKNFAEIPFCFSLYKSPLCHTLTNAFEISKDIPPLKTIVKTFENFLSDRQKLKHGGSLGLKPS